MPRSASRRARARPETPAPRMAIFKGRGWRARARLPYAHGGRVASRVRAGVAEPIQLLCELVAEGDRFGRQQTGLLALPSAVDQHVQEGRELAGLDRMRFETQRITPERKEERLRALWIMDDLPASGAQQRALGRVRLERSALLEGGLGEQVVL